MQENGTRLPELLSQQQLTEFLQHGKQYGLLTGLAGSLNLTDVATLIPLEPDYLGFRSALCRDEQRTQVLDPAKIQAIYQQIHPK